MVALAIVRAIGTAERFDSPQKLVSYLGLNPSVRQPGLGPAHHGRITKQGPDALPGHAGGGGMGGNAGARFVARLLPARARSALRRVASALPRVGIA